MIIVTGTAGFIGSHVARALGESERLLLVDDPEAARSHAYFLPNAITDWDRARGIEPEARHKLVDYRYLPKLLGKLRTTYQEETKELLPVGEQISAVVHIGAITDTSKKRDLEEMREWNTRYSQSLWHWCAREKVPFIYASSAATYGLGEYGFSDEHAGVAKLAPLNPYAQSKHEFDLWALAESAAGRPSPPRWQGLKFFNVYGPHEFHKGRMASTILFSYRSIRDQGFCPLFRSHKSGVADGEQQRDFIFVGDIVKIVEFFLKTPAAPSGIFHAGTGRARSFRDMARAVFNSLGKPEQIDWLDTPEEFRSSYQYFTEADTRKLRRAGFMHEFTSLEAGVESYVQYLRQQDPGAAAAPSQEAIRH